LPQLGATAQGNGAINIEMHLKNHHSRNLSEILFEKALNYIKLMHLQIKDFLTKLLLGFIIELSCTYVINSTKA